MSRFLDVSRAAGFSKTFFKMKGTSFFSNFSMRELVQHGECFAQLKREPLGGGGGGSSFHVRRLGSGETHFYSHRGDSFACRLSADESLDETHLFSVLKLDVERALNENGAQIIESGSSGPANF